MLKCKRRSPWVTIPEFWVIIFSSIISCYFPNCLNGNVILLEWENSNFYNIKYFLGCPECLYCFWNLIWNLSQVSDALGEIISKDLTLYSADKCQNANAQVSITPTLSLNIQSLVSFTSFLSFEDMLPVSVFKLISFLFLMAASF